MLLDSNSVCDIDLETIQKINSLKEALLLTKCGSPEEADLLEEMDEEVKPYALRKELKANSEARDALCVMIRHWKLEEDAEQSAIATFRANLDGFPRKGQIKRFTRLFRNFGTEKLKVANAEDYQAQWEAYSGAKEDCKVELESYNSAMVYTIRDGIYQLGHMANKTYWDTKVWIKNSDIALEALTNLGLTIPVELRKAKAPVIRRAKDVRREEALKGADTLLADLGMDKPAKKKVAKKKVTKKKLAKNVKSFKDISPIG